jgi:hypothetical protein
MWRINFNRLVVLQDRFFNKGTNANIPYKGGPGSLPKYLQPGDVDSEGNPQNEDYSLTGIAPTDTLKWFPLCDATRRAINCLTLLYIRADKSLLPEIIKSQQNALADAVNQNPPAAVSRSQAPPSGDDTAGAGVATEDPKDPDPAQLQAARQKITKVVGQLLELWGVYLREAFANRASDASHQSTLLAYQAGRAMASLSWDITVRTGSPAPSTASEQASDATAPANLSREAGNGAAGTTLAADTAAAHPSTSAPPGPPSGSNTAPATLPDAATQSAPTGSQGTDERPELAIWADVLGERNISVLQHQLAVIGNALDRCVQPPPSSSGAASDGSQAAASAPGSNGQSGNGQSATSGDTLLNSNPPAPGLVTKFDPTLPSEALNVVARSLTYWLRALQWLKEPAKDTNNEESTKDTNEEPFDDWEGLRIAFIAQVTVWEGLLLGQVGLRSYTTQSVLQAVLADIIRKVATLAIDQGIFDTLDKTADKINAAVVGAEEKAKERLLSTANGLTILLVVTLLFGISGIAIAFFRYGGPDTLEKLANYGTGALAAFIGLVGTTWTVWKRNSVVTSIAGDAAQVKETVNSELTDARSAVNAVAGATGMSNIVSRALAAVRDALDRGMGQIQSDLAGFCYSVAISYPLVEYLVLSTATSKIGALKKPYLVINEIVWNGDDTTDEVLRVAYAAFGPIGLYVLAQDDPKKPPATVQAPVSSNG